MELCFRNAVRSVIAVIQQIYFSVYLLVTQHITRNRTKANIRISREQYLRNIMDTHGNRILRLAYSYLHNMQDSEDILQDVLMKLIEKNPEFESVEHEKAWLLRVTANLAKNRIEYNKLRDTDELKDELAAEEREDLSFVWEAVKELPDNYREVIHLFYQEGYQTDEIAEILDETGANIRTRLKRARIKLKEILKKEYDFNEQI